MDLLRNLMRAQRGVAAVEMALVLPLFAAFMLGTVSYGSWFFLAHSVQQIANDAARAGVGGMNAAERATLVQAATERELERADMIDPENAAVVLADDAQSLHVTVSYDASESVILHQSFVPMPPLQIVRNAAVRLDTF